MVSYCIYNSGFNSLWIKTFQNFIDQWTYTRVAAETIKSEWFKFTVGGGDYPISDDSETEDYINKSFLNKVNEVYEDYKENIRKSRGNPLTNFDISKINIESNYRNQPLDQRIDFYKNKGYKINRSGMKIKH